MSVSWRPPSSTGCINCFRFILSGFPSHKKSKIDVFISSIILLSGFGRTVSTYINFGSANVFNTVIFPIKVSFRCCQDLRQFLNSCSFGNMFFKIVSFSLFVNVMPYVDASFDVQWKFISILR